MANETLKELEENLWLRPLRWETWQPVSFWRLRNAISGFEGDLEATVKQQGMAQGATPSCAWEQPAREALQSAIRACNNFEVARGWHYLKQAERYRIYGLNVSELRAKAEGILREASKITNWRKGAIETLIADRKEPSTLASVLRREWVAKAAELLDGHFDNIYQKYAIIQSRLRWLSFFSFCILLVWLLFPPDLSQLPRAGAVAPAAEQASTSSGAAQADTVTTVQERPAFLIPPSSPRQFWLLMMMGGIVGALLSVFITTLGNDFMKSRIPDEISTTTLAFARLFFAAVTAVVVSLFLLSGVLTFVNVSYEFLLAAAVAAGFSDQLLLAGIARLAP